MGAQNSANLNLKPSLDIKLHRKSRKDTILINLMQGDEICPTMPKPELIKKQLLEIFKNIEMDPKQKEKVLKLKPSLQWRLICSHNNFLKKNEETIEQVSKSESQNFIEKLKNNPSIITMQNLRRWLKKAALSDLRSFFLFDGVNILFKMLEVAELCSRNTKRYAKQIEILKIIQLISKHKEGLEEILKVSNSFTYVFFNLHPTHVELTCLVFEIIGGLLWNSNAAFELMLSSLNKLKTEKDYIFKFYPFLHILRHSNNVIMIENTLMFLNILLSSNNESHWRLSIKSELLACGIKHTIEDIKKNLEKKKYKILDCTYEIIQEELMKNKFIFEDQKNPSRKAKLTESIISEEDMNSREQQLIEQKKKRIERTIIKSRTDIYDEKKDLNPFETSEKLNNEDNEKQNFRYYLEISDILLFEQHLESLKNQLDVLENMSSDENNSIDEFKEEDYTNLTVLLSKIKDNALKNDTYASLIAILQKIMLFPINERGVELWEQLTDVIDKLVGNQDIEIDSSNMKQLVDEKINIEDLEKEINELKQIIEVRDLEIKKILNDKNKVMEENQKFIAEIKQMNIDKDKYLTENQMLKDDKINTSIAEELKKDIAERNLNIKNLEKEIDDFKKLITSKDKTYELLMKNIQELEEFKKKTELQIKNIEIKTNVPPPPIGLIPNNNNIPGPPLGLLPFINNNSNIPGPPLGLLPSISNTSNIPGPPLGILPSISNTSNIPGPPIGLLPSISNNVNIPGPPIGLLPSINNNVNIPGAPIGLLPTINNNVNIPGPPLGLLPPINNNINIPGPPLGLLPSINNNSNIPGPPTGLLPPPIIPGISSTIPGPPIGLLGHPGPPPIGNLLGGPPPIGNLLGGPPPLGSLLGGPPPLGLLLGGPPPIGNLLGGPPPIGNLLGGPPPIGNLLGGPPRNLLGGPPPIGNILGMAAAKPKIKEKKTPKVPMKGLMWTVIKPEQLKETIWDKIDDSKVEIDLELIEKSFCAKKPADPKANPNKIEEKPKIEKISIVVPERSKNVDLILMKLKLSFMVIAESFYTCDDSILTLSNLESFRGVLPTAAEIKEIKLFEGEIETLANPERFFLEVGAVPGYVERANALIFAKSYKDLVDDLNNKVTIILSVWKNLREDPVLKQILEYLLGFGNYLNGTSNRGGAYGIKLDAMDKAIDCKSTENPKKNLLMFIIQTIEEKQKKDLIDVGMDLTGLDTAVKVPMMQLNLDLGDIRKGAKFVDQALKKQSDKPHDKIKEKLGGFFLEITKIVGDFEVKVKECEGEYEKTAKFFCENPKDPSEKMAEKFLKLWNSCKNCKKELERLKLQAKKEAEKTAKELEKKKTEEQKSIKKVAFDAKSLSVNQGDVKATPSMTPLFTNLAKKTNTNDIMKELKERRESKMIGKIEERDTKNIKIEFEEGDQEKINKFGNLMIQGALLNRKSISIKNN